MDLDPAIRQMVDATNRGDSAAFLDAFTGDATLVDWGRTFTGRDEIARWDANENIGVQAHIDVVDVARDGDTVLVGVRVSGNGFNGESTFAFELGEGRIAGMRITG